MEWHEFLAEYAKHLDRVDGSLRGEQRWPGDFQIPTPTSDMPRSLLPYAKELLTRTSDLSDVVKERMAQCKLVLAQSRKREPGGRVVLLDVKA